MKTPKSNTNELWQTTYHWLKACGYKVNINYCKEEITTHPEYPTLISVIDFLEAGGMEYNAVQADPSYIHDLNYPLIAHIKKAGQETIIVITDVVDWDTKREITKYWSGIAVYPEKNTEWESENNTKFRINTIKSNVIIFALLSIGLISFTLSVIIFSNLFINLFGILSLLGLVISLFTLGTELGIQNQTIKTVCSAVSSGGCEQILNSQYAKGIFGFTPADASVVYFATQYLLYLLGSIYLVLFPVLIILAVLGVAVAAYSLYLQKIKIKKFCALCLGIVAVLILQLAASFTIPISENYYPGVALFFCIFFLLTLIEIPIKQLLKKNITNRTKLIELKKWKLDGNLFVSQWENGSEVETTIWENDLLLGNPESPLQFTIACNPYCVPCANAHKKLDKLLNNYPGKINVQLRFLCFKEDMSSKITMAVNSILQRAYRVNKEIELKQLLADWFECMEYENWIKKWQPDKSIDMRERLHLHEEWIKLNKIAMTPTFFLNGKKIPGRYSLDDVELLIPQLIELIGKGAKNFAQ